MWVLLFSIEAGRISYELRTFNLVLIVEMFKQHRTLGILFLYSPLWVLFLYSPQRVVGENHIMVLDT